MAWAYSPKASALPTALHPVMKFSNCGQICGQRRFLTSYRRGGKCCQPKCPKAFRVFRGLRPEPGPHAPKSRALPTALHPDIQFFCMIPCGERKSKSFVSVGNAVVKPDFAGFSGPANFFKIFCKKVLTPGPKLSILIKHPTNRGPEHNGV